MKLTSESAKLQITMDLYFYGFFLMFAVAWALTFPQEALSIVAALKRHLRMRVIRRTGTYHAKMLARALHEYATQRGIESELVDDVLVGHHDMIVERLGNRYADEVLGEPDPTERYY